MKKPNIEWFHKGKHEIFKIWFKINLKDNTLHRAFTKEVWLKIH